MPPLHRLLATALLLAALAPFTSYAQGVGIGTTAPNASAALDIVSTSKGVLLPRVSSTGSVGSPATGLIVYQTGSPAGYYYYDGTGWQQLVGAGGTGFIRNQTSPQAGSSFNVSGNGTVGTLTVAGAILGSGSSIGGAGLGVRADGGLNLGQNTTGNNVYLGYQAGQSTTGYYNLYAGYQSGAANTTGYYNTFGGYQSGASNVNGAQNTFSGANSGQATTSGSDNTFTGYNSGNKNTTGTQNTFSGSGSGYANTTGSQNTFSGYNAGVANTSGSYNQFAGFGSGQANTTGSYNTFNGGASGLNNTTGTNNTFGGYNSGRNTTTGVDNAFTGFNSGNKNTSGSYNTFDGSGSGYGVTTGNYNTFSGYNSGLGTTSGAQNTFDGAGSGQATTTGANNVFVGYNAGGNNTTGSSNTALGYNSGPASGSPDLTNATAVGANVGLTQSNTLVLGNGANVGIGTSTPAYALDVAGVANAGTGLRVAGNATAYYFGSTLYLGTSNLPATTPSGTLNTLVGTNAGLALTSGINNTVLGALAGDMLTTGSHNVLLGVQTGGNTTSGTDNVFLGHDAGYTNVGGDGNVAIGHNALYNSTADNNTALGELAGTNVTTGPGNTLLGSGANLSGSTQRSRATALGYNARVDQDDAVVLGDPTNVAVRTGLGTATPAAKLDLQGGANADGTSDPAALAFSWRSGGFRHFVRSRHNGTVTGAGNALDFYLNNSTAAAGSSAPGTGNRPVLTLESNNSLPRVGIGTTTPAVRLHVAGTAGTADTRLESLGGTGTRVVTADASGNLATSATATTALESLLRLQKGTATVGPGAANATVQVTITFPTAFATVPTVTVTPRNQDGTSYGDTFTATIRSVSTTQCVVNVRRMDNGDAWSQNLLLNWLAIP